MTYDQTNSIFAAMDDLETYAKMYQREMAKSNDADWEAASRYSDLIQVARKKIFDSMGESTDV